MYETVMEGKAFIRIKKADKISRDMEVFYNPVMKTNRDISILLLNAIGKKEMQIALPLAATGVRGIRFLKELDKDKIKSISLNDYSKKSVESIKNNLKLNKINKFAIIKNTSGYDKKCEEKIRICNEDANLFLLNSKGFDYIDVDPFGSSNPFLDAAVKRISREGILAVTNTDTAALTGTYPEVCARKYWAAPKLDYMMHETGLRILIRKVQLIGMQYEKALVPIFSYFKEHYFRLFFKCGKGKKEADKIAKMHGMINDAGPLWTGNLWDKELAIKIYNLLLKEQDNSDKTNNKELTKFLGAIKEESKINSVGFFDLHFAAEKMKLKKMITKENAIKMIKKLGYSAAATHFAGTGIRTDMPYQEFLGLLKE